jgi:hypothetical protein
MRFVAVVFAFACLAASAAPQPPAQPAADLRRAVRQYDAGSEAAPRRLTAAERAELRRQLTEQAPPARPLKQRKEP